MPSAMGCLWLLRGTAEQLLLRTVFQAWLYAQRLAVEARTALQVPAPRRPRRFDIFRYRYLLFTFKFWWRYCSFALHSMVLTYARWRSPKVSLALPMALTCTNALHRLLFLMGRSGTALHRLFLIRQCEHCAALLEHMQRECALLKLAKQRTLSMVIWLWFGSSPLEFFIQLAPPLHFNPLTCVNPHCIVEFLS